MRRKGAARRMAPAGSGRAEVGRPLEERSTDEGEIWDDEEESSFSRWEQKKLQHYNYNSDQYM